MIKIVVDEAIPFMKDRFSDEVNILSLPANGFTPDVVKDADAIIVRTRTQCDQNLLKGSSVKLIATATIGTDHIDIPWCESEGITIKNAAGCNAPGVAQYVFASLFKSGFDPSTQTLGIIGYGNVGQIVADWAKQMGIKFFISDPPRKDAGLNDVDYHEIDYVLKNSDAVTLHVPLTKSGVYPTYKMIGEQQLKLLRPGGVLVNSSRGGVVDEAALKKYLKSKRLKTIIDVWENEPIIDKELAFIAEVATPHIAGYSEEGKKRATRIALENITDVLGVSTNLEGLECIPVPGTKISKDLIEASYNPAEDHRNLVDDISSFESLRNNYLYRHEPLFMFLP